MFDRNNSSVETGDLVRLPSGREGTVVDIDSIDEVTVIIEGEEGIVCAAQIAVIGLKP